MSEQAIYGAGIGPQTKQGQSAAEMFTSLRFGQPSLLALDDGEFLATHWCVEEGQGKIRVHRIVVG